MVVGAGHRKNSHMSRRQTWLMRLAVLIFWLAVWEVASLVIGSGILLAGPVDVCVALAGDIVHLSFWSTVGFSFLRILIGFSCAFVTSILAAAIAHRFRIFRALLEPVAFLMKSIPIVCIIVLLLILAGSSQVPAIAVFLVVFPALYFSVLEGLARLDIRMIEVLDVFDVPFLRRVLSFYWPSVLPFVRASSKVAVGMGWKAGVAAELIGIPLGSIGAQLYLSKITLDTADLFAWTGVVVLASFLCEKGFLALLNRSSSMSRRLLRFGFPRQISRATVPSDIRLNQVTKHYDGRSVLTDVSVTFLAGSRSCILGASGIGKTTLLSLLSGVLSPDTGTVEGVGASAMVFQETRLFEELSAVDNIRLVAGDSLDTLQIRLLLRELLPLDALELPVSQLSGGMRRRVELCRALGIPSQTVILDEPFSGLDSKNRGRAHEFIEDHLRGRTLIVVSHDEEDARALRAVTLPFETFSHSATD
jgi:NitT/TauT family transport system permease protein